MEQLTSTAMAQKLCIVMKRKVRATELNDIAPKLGKEYVRKRKRSPGTYNWNEGDIPRIVIALNE